MVLELSESNFDDIVNQDKTVLVDFWAPWCGPCKLMGPLLDTLASQVGDDVQICKVNVDENPGITAKYGISSLPTLMVFKSGDITKKQVGFTAMAKLLELVS